MADYGFGAAKPLVFRAPGEAEWTEFVEWVRGILYVDHEREAVCYRPRVFDDWEGGDEWNRMNARRPVRVKWHGRMGVVAMDGCFVSWRAIKTALGVLWDGRLNTALPHPSKMSDAEIVTVYGLDYALIRAAFKRDGERRREEREDEAIRRIEARLERKLSEFDKRVARGLHPCKNCTVKGTKAPRGWDHVAEGCADRAEADGTPHRPQRHGAGRNG
jgi:hypothetical protein